MSPRTEFSPEDFAAATGVSRETLARLEAYAELLVRWQAKINLVGPDTVPVLWSRHMLDSAQLWSRIPEDVRATGPLVDLGSGAGFPGLVLAIMGQADVHLIDSDMRKGLFLREAARITATSAQIHSCRTDAAPPIAAAVITARACAPLPRLLELAAPFVAPGTRALFLKGRNVDEELTEAGRYWKMETERYPSLTDPSASILSLKGIARVSG